MEFEELKLRIAMEGGQVVAAEVDQISDSVDGLGEATDRAQKKSGGFWGGMGAGLKRAGKVGVAALGAIGAESVWAGIKFNETFESANASFATFLGSRKEAEKFTDTIRSVSRESPLRLTDYMEGAKMLLSYGQSAKNVVPTLMEVNKAIVATGQGSGEMLRVTDILGTMLARGKASAVDINRLAQAGVPVNKILRKELGLTGEQVGNIGREGIESSKVLNAILKGWGEEYGSAYEDAAGTLGFQKAGAIKDFEQFQREALEPVFDFLRDKVIPRFREFMGVLMDLPQAAKTAIVGVAVLGPALVAAVALLGGPLVLVGIGIAGLVALAIRYREQVTTATKATVKWISGAVNWVIGASKAVHDWVVGAAQDLADWVSTAANNVAGFVSALIPVQIAVLYVKEVVDTLKVAFTTAKPVILMALRGVWEYVKFLGEVFKIHFTAIRIYVQTAWNVVKRLGAIVGNVVAIISNLLRGDFSGAWRAAGRLVGNVWGLITDVARGALQFIRTIPGQILGLFTGLPGRVAAVTGGLFDGIKDAFKSAINWVIEKFNWFLDKLRSFSVDLPSVGPFGGGTIGIPGVPAPIEGLADGGVLRSAGSVLVGERGPELLTLPQAARVDPLPATDSRPTIIQLVADGRVLAEVVANHMTDAKARA